ncbi:MAG: hypothetical protein IKR04_07735 [Clostridia bacterium]|nr:hypothetical protein [Clostridia bacterium]
MNEENSILRCSSCGAELKANSLVNVKCAYCGSVHFIKEKFNEEFVPEAIVEFKNSNNAAEKLLKGFMKLNGLIKNDSDCQITSLTPIYVPCTIFNYGVDLYEKISFHERSGDEEVERSMEKRRKELYSIVQDGSKNVDDNFICSIEPFNYSNMKEFNPIYLSGTYTELYNDKYILTKSLKKIEKAVFEKIKLENGIVDCNIYTVDKVQAYLPIWLAKVSLNNGNFNFVMNDTTGKWVTNAVKSNSYSPSKLKSVVKIILLIGLLISMGFFIYSVFGHIDSIGISAISLYLFALALLVLTIPRRYRNQALRINFIRDVSEITYRPLESKVILDRSISKSDVIQGKRIRFYLDGKQI